MIIGVTGHRPNAIGGFKIPNPTYSYIVSKTEEIFKQYKPQKIITGMAIGYDTWVAEIAIKLSIPFIAAIPFVGQELFWPKETQEYYHKLLAAAESVETVSRGGFASWKMQARNQHICDNCDVLVAAFTGKSGGTANCIEYANSINKKIIIINPNDLLK